MRKLTNRSPRLRLLLLAGLVVVVAAAAGIAWATIPSGGVYTGCYMKSGGALRIIDASQQCKASETRITWNQQGQPGPAGSSAGALVRREIYQTGDPNLTGLHLSDDAFTTLATIQKPAGSAYDNVALFANVSLMTWKPYQSTIECWMTNGGGLAFQTIPGGAVTSLSFNGLDQSSGNQNVTYDLRCKSHSIGPENPSDLMVSWATLTVVPASDVSVHSN